MTQNKFFIGTDSLTTIELMRKNLTSRYLDNFRDLTGHSSETYLPLMSLPESAIAFTKQLRKDSIFYLTAKDELTELTKAFNSLDISIFTSNDEDFSAYNCEILISDELSKQATSAKIFQEGIELLTYKHPFFKALVGTVLLSLIPLAEVSNEPTFRSAFSFHFYKGGSFFALPDLNSPNWRVNFAVDIAHEIGHQVLMIYQMADKILDSSYEEPVFSGVRRVERPAIMSVHAAMALGYMIEYLKVASNPQSTLFNNEELQFAQNQLSLYKQHLSDGLNALAKCTFSQLGKILVNELKQQLV